MGIAATLVSSIPILCPGAKGQPPAQNPEKEKVKMKPNAGDAIRLTDKYSFAKAGSVGIIGGVVGESQDELQVTWNYDAFRGYSCYGAEHCPQPTPRGIYELHPHPNEIVSCSGGPGTIALPAWLLKPTGETITVDFWCWHDLPRAHSGVSYRLDVPVWEWDGRYPPGFWDF